MNYSPLQLKLTPTPGSSIDDCFDQAMGLSYLFKITVTFDFNGVHCGVRAGDLFKKDIFLKNFHKECSKDTELKICYANE